MISDAPITDPIQDYLRLRQMKLRVVVAAIARWYSNKSKPQRAPPRVKDAVTWESCTGALTDREFKRAYRLTRNEFNALHRRIITKVPGYEGSRSSGIDSRVRLASALRFLAGASYIDCMRIHGQRTAIFYRHFHETLDAILKTEPLGVDWTDLCELEKLERECSLPGAGNGAFRGIVGFVDGIVIRTRRPYYNEVSCVKDFYCARKKFWGINVQAVCTYTYKFTLFAVTTGSTAHDSTAFDGTAFAELTKKPESQGGIPFPFFLVGDAAYAGNPRILTPFAGSHAIGSDEDTYNYIHSSKRMAIECAFGVLVRRWGILWRPLEFSFKDNIRILNVLFRLHNICTLRRDSGKHVDRHHIDDIGYQPRSNEDVVDAYCRCWERAPDNRVAERTLRQKIAVDLMNAGCFRS